MDSKRLIERLLDVDAATGTSRALHREPAPYKLLEVRGVDAAEFLQRLCTQNVLAMDDGDLRPAAFLDAKGKLVATCLVIRSRGAFLLEAQTDQMQRLRDLLERYHFSEKLTIRAVGQACSEVIGRAARASPTHAVFASDEHQLSFVFERRGISFRRVHVLGAGEAVREPSGDLTPSHAECLRMLAGLVRVGVETEPTTLALEADLDDHISTTKGCYTGQEIVARIHTYGHVNRKLCLLHLAPGERIAAPQPLLEPEDDVPVGRVMHAVPILDHDARLGVGYLPKDFQALGTALRLSDGSDVKVIGYEPN